MFKSGEEVESIIKNNIKEIMSLSSNNTKKIDMEFTDANMHRILIEARALVDINSLCTEAYIVNEKTAKIMDNAGFKDGFWGCKLVVDDDVPQNTIITYSNFGFENGEKEFSVGSLTL